VSGERVVIGLLRLVTGVALVFAAVVKLLYGHAVTLSFLDLGMDVGTARLAFASLLTAEVAVGGLVLVVGDARSLATASMIVAGFTAWVLWQGIRTGWDQPCDCFAGLLETSRFAALVRNALWCIVLAVAAWRMQRGVHASDARQPRLVSR